MWFGNLVTMQNFTYLWLNEGFATYAGWLAVDAMYPEWHVWEQVRRLRFAGGFLLMCMFCFN